MGFVGKLPGADELPSGEAPTSRDPMSVTKCVVRNKMASSTGIAAHSRVARRAQPETSNSQQ